MQLKAHLLKKALIFSAFFYVPVFSVFANASVIPCAPLQIDETARVEYVYDGDTLRLDDGRKVRLMGIDTPEIFSKHRPITKTIKRSGEQAKVTLQQLLRQSNQRIGLAYGRQRFDRYQRTLAHIFLPDGQNVQATLISKGRAIAFTTPPNDSLSDCYRKQEAQARKQKRGIWALAQYQLKRTGQLTSGSDGFHRLQGKVTEIKQSRYRLTLVLDDTVDVKIRRDDLANFNVHMLNTLQNKSVEIRGWLHVKKTAQATKNKTRFIMSLRHPDAIKVLN